MPADLRSTVLEYEAAMRNGDRPRAIGLFRRIAEMFGNIDPDKLAAFVGFLTQLFGALDTAPNAAPAEASTVLALTHNEAIQAMSGFGRDETTNEASASAIDPSMWIQLIVFLVKFFRSRSAT